MKHSSLSPDHARVVPSVCDAEAGETPHDVEAAIDLASAREKASPPAADSPEVKTRWYTFWRRTARTKSVQ
ncbi:MAG TPA: hypothetical protein VGE08_06275 [Steroidobacter sp.]|uniref:hypothetical protein n=1 Tax=Steroidobacter sp. TaxID=1978227 RepID=UPI002ED8FB21